MEIRNYYNGIKEGLRTTKGRNILTFLIFLAISTVFWFLLALNDDVQEDYKLSVTLEDFPSEVTILSEFNPILNLTIKDKGSSLMKFSWGNIPAMKLRYDDFTRPNDTTLLLSSAQLNSAVRSIFGTGATIVSMRPDSLRFAYTIRPGRKVAVNIKSEIRTQPQFIYSGHGIPSVDSVMIYSNSASRFKVHFIPTQPISLDNLSDTVTVEAKLEVPPGMKAVPSTINVTFPVEPLVTKQQSVPVEIRNVPQGERVITFPSMVEVSYLLPKSMYGGDALALKATVDFNDIKSNSKTIPVTISKLPSHCKGITVHPSDVEYVVERID